MVLYQASQACCVNSRGAFLQKRFWNYNFKVKKLHSAALTLSMINIFFCKKPELENDILKADFIKLITISLDVVMGIHILQGNG